MKPVAVQNIFVLPIIWLAGAILIAIFYRMNPAETSLVMDLVYENGEPAGSFTVVMRNWKLVPVLAGLAVFLALMGFYLQRITGRFIRAGVAVATVLALLVPLILERTRLPLNSCLKGDNYNYWSGLEICMERYGVWATAICGGAGILLFLICFLVPGLYQRRFA
jgi:uncharacterized membrane protein